MMKTKTVTLESDQTIQVGALRYKSYKALKTEVLSLLSDDISAALSGVSESDIPRIIASFASKIGRVLGSLNEQFILGCIGEKEDCNLDDLPFRDIGQLFAAALEMNPIEEILEHEKNSPAGALVMSLLPLATGGSNLVLSATDGD